MNAQGPLQENVDEVPAKTWLTSKWRKIMLIVIAVDILPIIYGLILVLKAAGRVGIGNLLGDNYGSPVLWLSGAVIAGHGILIIGAVGLLSNSEWAIESIKIGAGIVFVFQCLALAVAIAFWIGKMFAIGQGVEIDPLTGDRLMMTGTVIRKLTLNTFLNPRMFATCWLAVAQMVMLMVAVEREKKEIVAEPEYEGLDLHDQGGGY